MLLIPVMLLSQGPMQQYNNQGQSSRILCLTHHFDGNVSLGLAARLLERAGLAA